MRIATLFLALPLAASLLAGCKKDSDAAPGGSFSIDLDARAGANAFALNTPVTLANGQTFTATTFKYYLSNVRLLRADGSAYLVPDSYYLVDAARPATTRLEFKNVPAGDYTGISFLAGVDAERNSSGAQTGALDPANGMFWTWDQGYIFTKLEGTSPASPTGGLVFHIGGAPNIRTVLPSFGTAKLTISDHHAASIHMLVDPTAMFESSTEANRISFATTYRVMSPTGVAGTIADNYAARMFSIGHVHNH